ncbi:hypothetical protein F183_A30470 [Bryobacterales bacterium F-183]|nr:hypothetical protein F183_A30470 [Bryobacterales bacterium F-183]
MSKFYLQHPEVDQLLAYSDGELKGLAATRIRRHLKDCWACRTQLEDLQATVTGFMRYKERVLEAQLPEPPSGWRNLKLEFERIDRTVPPPSFGTRMVARYGTPAIRVASVAAVLAVSGLGYVGYRAVSNAAAIPAVHHAESSAAVATVPETALRTPGVVVPKPAEVRDGHSVVAANHGNAEVEAVVALHKLGADLGEPIEIVRKGDGKVTVTATALDPSRRSQLRQALEAIPGVDLKFDEGRGALRNPARAAALVEGGRLPWQSELESILGNRQAVENFGNTVLDLSDSIVARAYALKNLDERFAAAALEPEERAQIDNIVAGHRAELGKQASELRKRLSPVLAKMGAEIPAVAGQTRWPLLTAAQQTDRWLNVIFAGAASTSTLEQASSELGRSLSSLQN